MKMIDSNIGHVMTLANSIIGVGILAMPYCFQKCGIALSIVLLIISNFITRLCCHYLLKTAVKARRKNFEFIASYIFGSSGKLLVELCIIGYLIGTCITYFVVVGDLGPQIIANFFNVNESDSLRTWIMVFMTIVCIIPLGLLRNIESLSHVCTTSIIFYFCLVVKIITESEEHISSDAWYQNLVFWEPAGIMQCLPIYSMALSCQMQLFEVYESLPNPSIEKMNEIVKNATNICTGVYIFVGFFGYIAFSSQQFSGNILLNLSTSFVSDVIKLGFVLSVAFSFPLVIFPCRASLYSLLYHRSHADVSHYIPEHRFKYITISIVTTSLIIGILMPSIEVVIGLVGSTIGVAICIMFPASCFIKTVKKNSTEKLAAQFLLVFGFVIMILGTYANLGAIDEQSSGALMEIEKMPPVRITIPDVIQKPVELSADKLQSVIEPNSLRHQISENLSASILQKENIPKIPKMSLKKKLMKSKVIANVKEINLNETNKNPGDKVLDRPAVVVGKPEIKQTSPNKTATAEAFIGPKTDSPINKDAIQKEEREIAIEANDDSDRQLEQTKNLLQEVKTVLEKQSQETQKLMLEKIDKISEKVNEIEKAQENKKHIEDVAMPEAKNPNNGTKSVIIEKVAGNAVNAPLSPAKLILNTQNITKNSIGSKTLDTDRKPGSDAKSNSSAILPVLVPSKQLSPDQQPTPKRPQEILTKNDETDKRTIGRDLLGNNITNVREKREAHNLSSIPEMKTKHCDDQLTDKKQLLDTAAKNNLLTPEAAEKSKSLFVRELRSINESSTNPTPKGND